MKKMLILLLCLPFCLCACQAEPETPPSGVLLADYWSEIPAFATKEQWMEGPAPSKWSLGLSANHAIEHLTYEEYLERVKSSSDKSGKGVFWEDIAALGEVVHYTGYSKSNYAGCDSYSYKIKLSNQEQTAEMYATVRGDLHILEMYDWVSYVNFWCEFYEIFTFQLPVKWTEITAIDTQNPLHLPERMQAPLIEGQEKRYSYYKTPAGFILFYHDGRLAGISGFHAEEEVYFSIPETDAATVEDIPFTSLRRLIELATRTV